MQPPTDLKLPHHTLFAYQLCLELVGLVARIRIADAQLRQQARKSAASAALNAAEGAARESAGDKRRCYGIASGEACEASAAVEIAGALGACSAADVQAPRRPDPVPGHREVCVSYAGASGLCARRNPANRTRCVQFAGLLLAGGRTVLCHDIANTLYYPSLVPRPSSFVLARSACRARFPAKDG
jgi:four helix bundle protein